MSKVAQPADKIGEKAVCEVVDVKHSTAGTSEDVHLVPCHLTAADLEYVDTITTGTFTEIIRTRRKHRSEIIVAKAFDQHIWRAEYLYTAELRFLKAVQGPWIVSFLGYIEDIEENFILMEYIPGGDLLQLMREHNLAEYQVRFYAAEMFMAVDYIHQRGFMHRNIMPSNFVIQATGHLKLIDFGLSYEFTPSGEQGTSGKSKQVTSPVFAPRESGSGSTFVPLPSTQTSKSAADIPRAVEGNTSYCAPEVLRLVLPKSRFKKKCGYTYLCDYWSLGVAIYNMLYHHLPFEADPSGCVMDKVLNFKKTLSFPLDKDVSFFAISIIKSLLVKEKKRLGARGISEVQDHLWFQKLDWGKLGDDSVSRPITLRETERFYRGTEGNLSVPASLVRRGSGGRESIQSEDSDEEFMDDLLMFREQKHVVLDFDVPLCNDPAVVEASESLKMLSAGTSSDESSKYGTSIDRKPSNMSMIRGRIKRPPQSRKDAYTKELTYGQRLLAWFTGNNVDGVDSPK